MPLRDHVARVLAGPERIECGWWDGEDVRRDYYLVETSHGQRAWAFRTAGEQTGRSCCTGGSHEPLPAYAELHCLSDFSFQRGASSARELFERAKQQGYRRWPSPTNARWPASCVRWRHRAKPACS